MPTSLPLLSAALQDSIVGVARPAELSALYRDLLSPYCPGLSLASCPSPQADSLRKAIAVKFDSGQTPRQITEGLVIDYGSDIRGSPEFEGFGSAAFLVPVVLLILGAVMITRWARRSVRRGAGGGAVLLLLCLPLVGCARSDDAELRPAAAVDGTQQVLDSQRAVANSAARNDAPLRSEGAWMRAAAAGATTAAYAVLHNTRPADVAIVGATSDVADTVEVHETMQHDGMVHMEPRLQLAIPAQDSVVFAPGGKHFMLRRLRRAVVAGDTVRVRVVFDDLSDVEMRCVVRPIGS